MRTPFSERLAHGLLGSLEKYGTSEGAKRAWESRERAEEPKDESELESDKPVERKVMEVLTPEQVSQGLTPNKKGNLFYKGVNVKDIREVRKYDPKLGLDVVVVKNPTKDNPNPKEVYKYTDEWMQKMAEKKMERVRRMGEVIFPLRGQVKNDLTNPDDKTRALATVVKMIDQTYMRVGGGSTEKDTGSSGATTLKGRHITELPDGLVRIQFKGKSGVRWNKLIADPDLAQNILAFAKGKARDQVIFPVSAQDVNGYLKGHTQAIGGITAKDMRTFHANRLYYDRLLKLPTPRNMKSAERNVREAVKKTAHMMGHTPSVCKKSYIDPTITNDYLSRLKKISEAA